MFHAFRRAASVFPPIRSDHSLPSPVPNRVPSAVTVRVWNAFS